MVAGIVSERYLYNRNNDNDDNYYSDGDNDDDWDVMIKGKTTSTNLYPFFFKTPFTSSDFGFSSVGTTSPSAKFLTTGLVGMRLPEDDDGDNDDDNDGAKI